jgi:hypothetical protein
MLRMTQCLVLAMSAFKTDEALWNAAEERVGLGSRASQEQAQGYTDLNGGITSTQSLLSLPPCVTSPNHSNWN